MCLSSALDSAQARLAAELPRRKRRILLGTLGSCFAFSEQPEKNLIFGNVVFRLAVAQPAASCYGERGGNDFICVSRSGLAAPRRSRRRSRAVRRAPLARRIAKADATQRCRLPIERFSPRSRLTTRPGIATGRPNTRARQPSSTTNRRGNTTSGRTIRFTTLWLAGGAQPHQCLCAWRC
jgi:hypothetical protein